MMLNYGVSGGLTAFKQWTSSFISSANKTRLGVLVLLVGLASCSLFAATTGSISGTVTDAQGARIPDTKVELQDTLTGIVQTIVTDSAGFYNFASLPLGHYNVTFEKGGFEKLVQTGVVIDVDTERRVDATLKPGSVQTQITVTSTQVQVDTETTELSEVMTSAEIADMPLDGRAYTDLMVTQPGVVPISTSEYGTITPSNNLNSAVESIAGAQDVHSGFTVNGANVVDGAGEGTFLMPTLDSIAEFRIVTNNAGAEYGGYSGGQTNVVTKSGTNKFHGDAFEFFRNGDMNSTGYFETGQAPPNLHQNIYGGTVGGPIIRNKVFFFGDYQGWQYSQGNTVNAGVPSTADRTGDLSDQAGKFLDNPRNVSGPYMAQVLTARLGYGVTSGEPYYNSACTTTDDTSPTGCVLGPTLQIPKSAWDPVSANVLALIPPGNTTQGGLPHYISSAAAITLNDQKGAIRAEGATRFGNLYGYYHLDPWSNPNPPTYGTAVPGFPNIYAGKAQLYVVGLTTPLGSTAVNTFTVSYTRNANIQGLTSAGGSAYSFANLGFAPTGVCPSTSAALSGTCGGPAQEAVGGAVNFPDVYGIGAPGSIVAQYNNTYEGQEDFSKVVNTHTFKFGGSYLSEQVNLSHPTNGSNGSFGIDGNETGNSYADLLLGATSSFSQGAPASLNLRNFYAGLFAEDSWRATHNLTVNYGVRWEVNPFWGEEHNRNPVIRPGLQSIRFPNAPLGFVFPGEDGVPKHLANINWDNFGPRTGLSYSPDFKNSVLHAIFGDPGKSSVRGAYGLYFTNIEGYDTYNFGSPPYSFYGGSSQPVFLSQPFIARASGQNFTNPFPIVPSNFNWASIEPLTSRRGPPSNHEASPYEEQIDFSIEREITSKTLLTASYVGTFGHHLTVDENGNPGDPALCLSLSQPSEVTNGVTCGPGGASGVYYPVNGPTVHGTRGPVGSLYQGIGNEVDGGNSSYNGLLTSLRYTSERLTFLVSYTFSKAIDNGSGRGDIVWANDPNHFRGLSDYDIPNVFATRYSYELPFDKFIHGSTRLTRGWKVAGITQFSQGVPIWVEEYDDNNLRGDLHISAWGQSSTDQPVQAAGNIKGDHNPRHYNPWFNVNLFSEEPVGGQGNAPKRSIIGPGIDNTNLTLMKDVRIREGITAEFRVEGFNAFNHAQFAGAFSVDGNYSDGAPDFVNGQNQGGTFGLVQGDDGGRTVELAGKLTF
jgi:hypothetical protein